MRLARDLAKRFPDDTIVQLKYLPIIRAATILGRGSGSKEAVKAIEVLATAVPYELGMDAANMSLYPVYLRAEAYHAAEQGSAAVAEFRKILNHPGVVASDIIGALACLGLGRAYALEARIDVAPGSAAHRPFSPAHIANSLGSQETTKDGAAANALANALSAYQNFLTLWKEADPDIPINRQAESEYAKLQ